MLLAKSQRERSGWGLGLWKLPRLMDMWKIKQRKGNILQLIFHIPTAAWKTLHSTSFHSEFSTVPTAPTAGSTNRKKKKTSNVECVRFNRMDKTESGE